MKLTVKTLVLFGLLLVFINCASNSDVIINAPAQKYKGLSFVASYQPLDTLFDEGMAHMNSNALAIMPYGFMRHLESSNIEFNVSQQWWGERVDGCKETIRLAHGKGYKVMLKPQIWIGRGGFTGHINMPSEEEWIAWESSYENFILTWAEVAQEEKVDLFCVGTELATPLKTRPTYWIGLVQKVKEIYKGKITYAENWDSFDAVPFFDQLDFIGVNAYFPLSEKKDPSERELKKAWVGPIDKMKACAQKWKKPILLTEFGYRNKQYSAKEPWRSEPSNEETNEDLQARLFRVCFEQVWSQNWVAGGFVWKWFPKGMNHEKDPSQFTPENKLAEKTIQHYYSSKEK